jgi:uncharacterized protein DUF1579
MHAKLVCCLVACCSLAAAGYAQQGPPIPKPGPEHEILKQDVGTWDATVEMAEPGKPTPTVSKGTETTSLVGGFWAVSDFKSEMMGQPFEGRGTVGFDTNKKKYVSTWVDSMSTGFMTGEATYDPKTKTMTGFVEGFDPGQGSNVKMKQTTEYKDADSKVFTMYMTGPDGKEVPMMKITYKRRK